MKQFYTLFYCLFLLGLGNVLYAQKTVSGKVTDERGETLIGVSIYERGTLNGTVTNLDGQYSLQYKGEKPVMVFSYIGYQTQEITLAGQSTLDVVLKEGVTLNNVEIVGSRSLNRSSTETPVAIDIIDVRDITNDVGQLDMHQLLQYAAPSFNANHQSGSDGSDHIDPATIRGLGPDQTLVLLNGKRRHQSSLINVYGTRGRGNTGTDLNTIPTAAIERIEILRDGAAAQYGSDAIAGVMNIVLKTGATPLTVNVNTGAYQTRNLSDKSFDGLNTQVNANYGLSIGEKGYVNLTADYWTRGMTNRPNDADLPNYRRNFGDASLDQFSTYYNTRIDIDENSHFYSFGGYNQRSGNAYAWTRWPDSDRNIPAIYPNGFDPIISSVINDKSISAGVRTKLAHWDADFNNTFGINRFGFFVDSTLNVSLGMATPTRFDAGGFQFSQNTTSLNLSHYYDSFLSGVNVAFGTEYRIDNYQIFAGEEASWRNYGFMDTVVNGVVTTLDKLGVAGGSQGFPGFRPSNEVNESRTNLGVFMDLELNLTEKWMLGIAGRFEHYSDFGNTFNPKIATRYEISDNFALRASASTGFRAPSLAQIYYNSVFTNVIQGVPVDALIATNHSNVTRALGIPSLTEETALNAAAGFTLKLGKAFTATVDGYYIDVKDRIVLTGSFDATDEGLPQSVRDALNTLKVGVAQFFTNAVDTRTMGVDVVLAYSKYFGEHRLRASLAGNFNNMEILKVKTNEQLAGLEDYYFGAREKAFLLASAPPSKINLTLDYKYRKFNTNLRLVRFDGLTLIDWYGTDDTYAPAIVADLSVGYEVCKYFGLTVGVSNLLNTYPSKTDVWVDDDGDPTNGAEYNTVVETEGGGMWDAVQMGINGRYLFARASFKL
jgi:iron complex outermembrane receptor protein